MKVRLTIQGQSMVVELKPMSTRPRTGSTVHIAFNNSVWFDVTYVSAEYLTEEMWFISDSAEHSTAGLIKRGARGWFEIDTITLEE